MPQATFVLKNPSTEKENAKNPTLIYLFYTFNKSRLKYSTGQKVPPKYWNPEKQRVKVVKEFRQAESINLLLDKLEGDVSNEKWNKTLKLATWLSTDATSISTCLGLLAQVKVELEIIIKTLQAKISERTLFTI
jgi:hypothetical protein